jgi:hypothetical protein
MGVGEAVVLITFGACLIGVMALGVRVLW